VLAPRVIPCLDIRAGRVVKGIRFVDLTDAGDPVALARSGEGFEVVIDGGRTPAGRDAVAWAREVAARGAGELLVTSIDADGTRAGYDLALTRAIRDAVDVPVIASGGAGTIDHFAEVFAEGADAALAASLFHYGELRIGDLKDALRARGVPVRRVAVPTR
jgi:cyclase